MNATGAQKLNVTSTPAGTGRTYLYLLRNGNEASYPITLVDA